MSNKLERAVSLAHKVRRPLTFFVIVGFMLLGLIPTIYALTPDDATLIVALPAVFVPIALIVDLVCTLLWAKARLAANPNAFDDE